MPKAAGAPTPAALIIYLPMSTCGNSISHRDLAPHGHDLVVHRTRPGQVAVDPVALGLGTLAPRFPRTVLLVFSPTLLRAVLGLRRLGDEDPPAYRAAPSCTSHITVISSTSCTCGRAAPRCSCEHGGSRRASATTSQTTSSLSLPRPLECAGPVALQCPRPSLRLPDLRRRHVWRVGTTVHERPARGTRHQIGHRAPGGTAEQLHRRADQSSSPQNGQYLMSSM